MPWEWSGDRALLRRFDDEDVAVANRRAHALAASLRGRFGATDVVPGARTLLVVLPPGAPADPELLAALDADVEAIDVEGARHEILVRYGGLDLDAVAERHEMSVTEVIDLHSSADYVVAFTGFSPGFPYLLGLPERLHTPRFAAPRRRVDAGSVAIGGEYTGIYPRPTPGGWRLIGQTDAALFDPRRRAPVLLQPGDRVRFVPS
jgi:KipI family sensor histidine kinase inhibitor